MPLPASTNNEGNVSRSMTDEQTPLLPNDRDEETPLLPKKPPTALPWRQLSIILFLQLSQSGLPLLSVYMVVSY